ncbi:velvet factor [Gorgonomyces haynaldii]|nr:velvet factor [Gorgonomyces haynaldii]
MSLLTQSEIYELSIVQNPIRGRMSGFSSPKDTRLIAPHLILQAKLYDNDRKLIAVDTEGVLLCKVVLIEDDVPAKKNPVDTPNRELGYDSNILGNTIVNGQLLRDQHGEIGLFFIFTDLGIRSPGKYRLRCYLMNMEHESDVFPVSAVITTRQFRVFAPKSFPGKIGMTEISKHFLRQGVSFHIARRLDRS